VVQLSTLGGLHAFMKDKTLIYISLIISIAALCYAAWVHQHAEQMANQVFQEREKHFVQTWAPKIRDACEGFGVTNMVANPTTLDELMHPMFDSLNVVTPLAKEEKGKP
jgi:hypothetical protein